MVNCETVLITSVTKNEDEFYPELFLEKSLYDKMINIHK